MTKIPFREFHLLKLMEFYTNKHLPLDLAINKYFREHKSLGSKDRTFIATTAFQLVRWKGLIEAFTCSPDNWEKSYELLTSTTLESLQSDESIPLHCRFSCPHALFSLLENQYGTSRACELSLLFNERAPLTVRVNTLKIDRNSLFNRWQDHYEVTLCDNAAEGITFKQNTHLFGTEEFKKGLFEVQDEGSQQLSNLIKAEPGNQILDYCAGAGGKSLAIAAKMKNKGQLYLHDVRSSALKEAKKRLLRAGVQNAQIYLDEHQGLRKLRKKMDWVLVDAPCSGTGTLRRNLDMKWRFNEATLTELIGLQRSVFEKALSYVKPGGKIVYATCSILKGENEVQIEHFLKTYPITLDSPPLVIPLVSGGSDGFFAAVFSTQKEKNYI